MLKRDYNRLKISFGGNCLRRDPRYNCEERDVKTIRVKRLAILVSFHDKNCKNGDDMAIIELESDIKVGKI